MKISEKYSCDLAPRGHGEMLPMPFERIHIDRLKSIFASWGQIDEFGSIPHNNNEMFVNKNRDEMVPQRQL